MLDVIMLVVESTPKDWLAKARDSVRAAIDCAGYPVRFIEVQGIDGHIGQGLANGLALSTAPYVTWVDNDDWVKPEAFRCLREAMASQPDAICAREIQVGWRGQEIPAPRERRHHLTAWRRDVLEEQGLANNPVPSIFEMHAHCGDIVDVYEWVYYWRIYLSKGMALRVRHTARAGISPP